MDQLDHIEHLDDGHKIKFLEIVARGSHSVVWRGTMTVPDGELQVAIKVLHVRHYESDMPHQERLRRRFLREVAVWISLRHQNIVPLLGNADPSGLPKLISPWYMHGSVISYLQKQPNSDRLKLLLDVARGLAYLHSLPLVHGDIKAENVLVDVNGSASICDFGLSKFVSDALHITGFTTSSPPGGTLRFMAPELLDDEPKTTMSDIWAFGCVAIQIMTGLTPYQQFSSTSAVLLAIILGDPPLHIDCTGCTNQETLLWREVRKCWMEPRQRPNIDDLVVDIDRMFNVRNTPRPWRVDGDISFWEAPIPGAEDNALLYKFNRLRDIGLICCGLSLAGNTVLIIKGYNVLPSDLKVLQSFSDEELCPRTDFIKSVIDISRIFFTGLLFAALLAFLAKDRLFQYSNNGRGAFTAQTRVHWQHLLDFLLLVSSALYLVGTIDLFWLTWPLIEYVCRLSWWYLTSVM